jgi:hypothetical protein
LQNVAAWEGASRFGNYSDFAADAGAQALESHPDAPERWARFLGQTSMPAGVLPDPVFGRIKCMMISPIRYNDDAIPNRIR